MSKSQDHPLPPVFATTSDTERSKLVEWGAKLLFRVVFYLKPWLYCSLGSPRAIKPTADNMSQKKKQWPIATI